MAAKLVSVFGGTGFLGRRVVRHLVAAGMRVRVVAHHPVKPEGWEDGNIELQPTDIQDTTAVAAAVAGAQAVVNAVSLYVETRDASFAAIHVDGAERLARLARDAGVERLVHISGIGADPGSPSRYVAARGLGEQRVRLAFPQATLLRPSVLFGSGDAFLSTLDGITRLPVVPLFGAGRTRLQPVHVDDVAAAVVRILERADTAGRVFELGGGRVCTYREILDNDPRLPAPPAASLAGTLRALDGTGRALAAMLPRPPLTRDQAVLKAQRPAYYLISPVIQSPRWSGPGIPLMMAVCYTPTIL